MDRQIEVWHVARSKGTALFLLLALANRANATGEVEVSNEELATDTGLCKRSIRTLMRKLEEIGDICNVSPGGLKRGDRRRLVLAPHLITEAQPPTAAISVQAMLVMPMRKEANSAPLLRMGQLQRLRALRAVMA